MCILSFFHSFIHFFLMNLNWHIHCYDSIASQSPFVKPFSCSTYVSHTIQTFLGMIFFPSHLFLFTLFTLCEYAGKHPMVFVCLCFANRLKEWRVFRAYSQHIELLSARYISIFYNSHWVPERTIQWTFDFQWILLSNTQFHKHVSNEAKFKAEYCLNENIRGFREAP